MYETCTKKIKRKKRSLRLQKNYGKAITGNKSTEQNRAKIPKSFCDEKFFKILLERFFQIVLENSIKFTFIRNSTKFDIFIKHYGSLISSIGSFSV